MSTETKQETAVEDIKRSSNHLRGELSRELDNDVANVSNESEHILKFHGVYAQDNRDVRRERAQNKESLDYIFMIRVAIPGGRLSSDQWLALDAASSDIADGTIRLTTRQAVQFHGVLKGGLRPLARTLDEHLMTSFGACGDVVRNVVSCPELQGADSDLGLREISRRLTQSFRATTEAHWEIFVNGDKAASREEVTERPFYGDTYLPRKFKIAVAHPHENCVDVFAQDIGLIPGEHPEAGQGFTLLVGGGLGRAYANADTFARLADPMTFVTYDEVEEVIAAILLTYRELGDRTDRKRARMKYVVADIGFEQFRKEIEVRLGRELRGALALPAEFEALDHLGWRTRDDATHQVGIRVSAGRVRDEATGAQLRSALRLIAQRHPVTFFLTAQQDVVVSAIPADAREDVESILAAHRVRPDTQLGNVERTALACPALPTCGQALTEAERRLPELVDTIEGALATRQLGRRALQLRMTGCPNGCARPAVAEVGIVGRTKSTYDVYVGGGPRGDRLATLYREKVPFEEIAVVLGPLFDRWESEGDLDESFGDFVTRVGAA
ncbi:MAG: NADPH-dependent assimilatory sulfite reductase hemoprotein subunit [Acidimicrobiales bacterium]